MRCPYCSTENRDDREKCYHCGKDLTMLRLIRNKAKQHYNNALEHAERGRSYEAMGELKNALELDHQLGEARLLLGTLYARLERMEEAREQWERVLGDDPNARRAHDYLGGLPELKRALPIVGRVRALLATGAALAGVGVIALAIGLWPSHEERVLAEAWQEFARPRPGSALELLAELPRPLASEERELSAQLLESSVDSLVRERVNEVNQLIADEKFDEAGDAIEALRAWDLPAGYRKALDQTGTLLATNARRDLLDALESPFTPEGLEIVQRRAEVLAGLQPSSKEVGEAVATYKAKGEAHLAGILQGVEQSLATGADLDLAEARLAQSRAVAEALGRGGEVEHLAATLERRRLEQHLADARQALAEDDPARALDILRTLPAEAGDATIAKQAKEIEERAAVLEREQRHRSATRLADAVTQLLDAGELEEALDLAAGIELDDLTDERRTDLTMRLETVRRQAALDAYYTLMRQAEAFDAGALSESEARRALQRIARIDGNLPPSMASTAQDDLLFFAASSLLVLGDTAGAQERIETLRETAPGSPYHVTWKKLLEQRDASSSS